MFSCLRSIQFWMHACLLTSRCVHMWTDLIPQIWFIPMDQI
ncbi:hypothetical protein SAMN05444503_1178 [Pseudomonas sp. BS3767]|nr:hypothetical protein SAMN05444503_1178 [Pseudomonas sp. BS3767]